jgi:hypothetical protein
MRNFPCCGARRIPIDDTDTELVLRVLAPELAQELKTARCARGRREASLNPENPAPSDGLSGSEGRLPRQL